MAITLVNSANEIVPQGSSSTNVTLPASMQEDDVVVYGEANNTDISFYGGGLANGSSTGWTAVYEAYLSAVSLNVYWKRMGSTPDSVVNVAEFNEAWGDIPVITQAWRGVDTTTAIDDTATSDNSPPTGDPDPPSFTTVTDGAMRIIVGAQDDENEDASATAPSGYSNLVAEDQGDATYMSTIMMASKEAASAGAEDPDSFTTDGNDTWQAIHFALRPASSGTTYEESITLASARSLAPTAVLAIPANINLDSARSISPSSDASIEGTLSLTEALSLSPVANLVLDQSISLDTAYSFGVIAGLAFDLSVLLDSARSFSPATTLTLDQAIALSEALSMAFATDAVIEATPSFNIAYSLDPDTLATIEATSALNVAYSFGIVAGLAFELSANLNVAYSLATTTQIVFGPSITLALAYSFVPSTDASIEVAAELNTAYTLSAVGALIPGAGVVSGLTPWWRRRRFP